MFKIYQKSSQYTLNFIIITPLMSLLLLHPETLGKDIFNLNLTPCYMFSPSYIMGIDMKITTKNFKPHNRTHHVDIIVISVIIIMLTLCYFIIPHATLILFYHAIMLTLHNSIISCTLWLPHKRDIIEFTIHSDFVGSYVLVLTPQCLVQKLDQSHVFWLRIYAI